MVKLPTLKDITDKINPPKKIGIALGSGSARGWAHIGVLQCLEENHIPIHCLSGTSIGSYVGIIYAAGDLEKLDKFARNMDRRTVWNHIDISFPKSGFVDGKHIPDLITACTDAKTFEDLKIPVEVPASDIISGNQIVFNEGSIFEAIRASSSVPGVLTPYKYEDKILVDGGILNPVPVDLCRKMGADICIAVDLHAGKKGLRLHKNNEKKDHFKVGGAFLSKFGIDVDLNDTAVVKGINKWLNPEDQMPNILDILGASLDIMESQVTDMNMRVYKPDILITPKLEQMKMFDFHRAGNSIVAGYNAMDAQIESLKRLIE